MVGRTETNATGTAQALDTLPVPAHDSILEIQHQMMRIMDERRRIEEDLFRLRDARGRNTQAEPSLPLNSTLQSDNSDRYADDRLVSEDQFVTPRREADNFPSLNSNEGARTRDSHDGARNRGRQNDSLPLQFPGIQSGPPQTSGGAVLSPDADPRIEVIDEIFIIPPHRRLPDGHPTVIAVA